MFNITLGLQACNFLITYGILRRFFFRPVLRQIELEGHEQARILHFIDRSRAILRDSYCQQQDLWLKARSQFERQLIFCEKLKVRMIAQDPGLSDLALTCVPDLQQVKSSVARLMLQFNQKI